MATYAERILRIISTSAHPLDDDEIAQRMGIVRQNVNQICRRLEAEGLVRRVVGPTGKIVNRSIGPAEAGTETPAPAPPSPPSSTGSDAIATSLLTEDDVKRCVATYLRSRGLHVEVKWGRDRGIDILASGAAERWVVEAKGAVASDQQQGNYFLGALGELVQRMDDPDARYALALPDNRRYRGLVARLPELARMRFNLTILFVSDDGQVTEVLPSTPSHVWQR
jgi:hypothetical protein